MNCTPIVRHHQTIGVQFFCSVKKGIKWRAFFAPNNKGIHGKARMPEKKARMPEKKARMPEKKARMPEKKARMPEKKARMPKKKARMQQKRTTLGPNARVKISKLKNNPRIPKQTTQELVQLKGKEMAWAISF